MPNRTVRVFSAVVLSLLVAGASTLPTQGRGFRGGSRATVNRNVNRNVHRDVDIHARRDVDVHVRGGYRGGCCYHDDYHPIATAAAVTATAMVIGSMVNTLPPSCTVIYANGISYQQCGNTYYQPQFVGTSTSYVVVAAPM